MAKASLAHQFYTPRRPIVDVNATSDTIVHNPGWCIGRGLSVRVGPAIFGDSTTENHAVARDGKSIENVSTQPAQEPVLRTDSGLMSSRRKQIRVGLGRSHKDVQVRDAQGQADHAHEKEADEERPGRCAVEVAVEVCEHSLAAPEARGGQTREQCDNCEMHLGLVRIHRFPHVQHLREEGETIKPEREHPRDVNRVS